MTDRFKDGYYYNSAALSLPNQTNYTPELIWHAHRCLERIFVEGKIQKRLGIIVTALVPQNATKLDLFQNPVANKGKQQKLMEIMDSLNKRFG